jgi:hypothetical protein
VSAERSKNTFLSASWWGSICLVYLAIGIWALVVGDWGGTLFFLAVIPTGVLTVREVRRRNIL